MAVCVKLCTSGCNARTKNGDGVTARVIAKEMGFKNVLKELKKAEKLPTRTPTQKMLGSTFGEPEAVRLYDWSCACVEKLLNRFQQTDVKKTSLISAEEFWDCLEYLMAPINEDGKKRLSQLHDQNGTGMLNYIDFVMGSYVPKQYRLKTGDGKKKKKGKKAKSSKKGKAGGKVKTPIPICMNEDMPKTPSVGLPEDMIPRCIPFIDSCRYKTVCVTTSYSECI